MTISSLLAKFIPVDKQLHIAAGAISALFGAATWFVLGQFVVLPSIGYAVCAQLCGLVAGITKEVADYMDNKICAAEGRAPMHGVDVMDAVATAAPGAVIAGLVLALL